MSWYAEVTDRSDYVDVSRVFVDYHLRGTR